MRAMPDDELQPRPDAQVQEKREPPVVARMVIEIRSDGTRTVARGAVEDVQSGERVELHAEGATPLLLIGSLLRSLADLPSLARKAATLLLAGRPKR
jgi:hypothetical protein